MKKKIKKGLAVSLAVILSLLMIPICLMGGFVYTPQMTAKIDDFGLFEITDINEYYSEYYDFFHKHISKTDRNQYYFVMVYYSVYNESEKCYDFYLPLIKSKSVSSTGYRIRSKRCYIDDINFSQIAAHSNKIGCQLWLLIQSDLPEDDLLQSLKTNMSIEIILSSPQTRYSSPSIGGY